MRCEWCDEVIKYEATILALPSYCSTHEIAFCSDDCIGMWFDYNSRIEDVTDND